MEGYLLQYREFIVQIRQANTFPEKIYRLFSTESTL